MPDPRGDRGKTLSRLDHNQKVVVAISASWCLCRDLHLAIRDVISLHWISARDDFLEVGCHPARPLHRDVNSIASGVPAIQRRLCYRISILWTWHNEANRFLLVLLHSYLGMNVV